MDQSGRIIQEYIPPEHAEDWIFHGYCNAQAECMVKFTGRKYRSWPAQAGVTTFASAETNEELLDLGSKFLHAVGYSGIVDMDWRYDRRDKRFKLVDFNPRLGANFRLFITANEIDVVRAAHLDLTGREIPRGPQIDKRYLMIENLDLVSRLVARSAPAKSTRQNSRTELAWFAVDDLAPFVIMAIRFSWQAAARISVLLGRLLKRASSRRSNS